MAVAANASGVPPADRSSGRKRGKNEPGDRAVEEEIIAFDGRAYRARNHCTSQLDWMLALGLGRQRIAVMARILIDRWSTAQSPMLVPLRA